LAPHEHVNILVNDAAAAADVRQLLQVAQVSDRNVFLHLIPTDDAWARDHGPTFITRKVNGGAELGAIDWIYNAWGGKYPPWDADDAVPRRISDRLGIPVFAPGIVLE